MKVPLVLELFADPAARGVGLSDRRSLPSAVDGAAFLFEGLQPPSTVLWNRSTYLPLDLLFIGQDARVLSLVPMRTIEESGGVVECYASPSPFSFALELLRGRAAALGVAVGSSVSLVPVMGRPHVVAIASTSGPLRTTR